MPPSFQDVFLERSFGGKAQRHEHVSVLCVAWEDENAQDSADVRTPSVTVSIMRTNLIRCKLSQAP
jgi:hypothetical protein